MKRKLGIMTIDIGTSSMRVSLFDKAGVMLDWQSKDAYASPSFDVEPRMEALYDLMRLIAQNNPEVDICRICPSTLISWVFCTKTGQAVTPVYTFADFREKEMESFLESFDERDFYERTGRAPSAELPVFKMIWLKTNDTDAYQKADYLMSYLGYINLCLTGNAVIDYTFAAFSGLSNIQDGVWDKKIVHAAGLDEGKLPAICEADRCVGILLPELQKKLGIGPARIVCGTSDGSSGVVGSGTIAPGCGLDVMGSTDVFYVITDHPVFEKNRKLILHPHPLRGLWLTGGATGLTGGAFDWAVKTLGQGKLSYEEINSEIEKIAPGSDGLMAISAFSGERAPRWLPKVRGGLVNLQMHHTLAHCCRAFSEASAYLTKEICTLLKEEDVPIENIIAIGGGAKSDTNLQLRSNVLNYKISVPQYLDATTRGCYALAMLSLGKTVPEIAINSEKAVYMPDENAAGRYQELFTNYVAFYEQYKNIYQ